MNLFASRSTTNYIPYPARLTEFESHALLYNHLRTLLRGSGYLVHGDVQATCRLTSPAARRRMCRFDIVIFAPSKLPVVIIEIKRQRKNAPGTNTRQLTRYRSYGVPVLHFWDLNRLKEFDVAINTLIENHERVNREGGAL